MVDVLQWPVKEITGNVIIDGMPNEAYHSHKSISSSGLRTGSTTCWKKYWYNSPHNPNKPKQEQKACYVIGSAAHDLMLQRDEFFEHNYVLPKDYDGRKKEFKGLKEEIISQGLNVIQDSDFDKIKGMVKAVDAHPFASAAFTNGKAERSLFWKDKETGVICRCRPDYLPNDFKNVPDYKTTADASPAGVDKSMANFGYHMQDAWYMEGIEAVTGVCPERFFFVNQEKEAPYIVTCSIPDMEAIEYGKRLNRKALREYAECLSKDKWPEYSEGVIVSSLPFWELQKLDNMIQEGTL